MAQAVDRSMVGEFQQGCLDSSYIDIAPNVGGIDTSRPWRAQRAAEMPTMRQAGCLIMDPWAQSRALQMGRPFQPLSRYQPRRDRV